MIGGCLEGNDGRVGLMLRLGRAVVEASRDIDDVSRSVKSENEYALAEVRLKYSLADAEERTRYFADAWVPRGRVHAMGGNVACSARLENMQAV